MSWLYEQFTGYLFAPDNNDSPVEQGYAGHGDYVNKPRAEWRENEGPLPTGIYTIGDPIDDPNMGPCVLSLTPDSTNTMYGRSGFYIHGDSSEMNQTASEGCIILSRATRDRIAASDDRRLEVVVGVT